MAVNIPLDQVEKAQKAIRFLSSLADGGGTGSSVAAQGASRSSGGRIGEGSDDGNLLFFLLLIGVACSKLSSNKLCGGCQMDMDVLIFLISVASSS